VRDAVYFQERGIPTATVCHDAFATAARSQATNLGYPDLPLIIIPQEKRTDTPEILRKHADEALQDAIAGLTGVHKPKIKAQ